MIVNDCKYIINQFRKKCISDNNPQLFSKFINNITKKGVGNPLQN